MTPVSYTHLDVYKRQEVFSATPENTYVCEDSFHGLQAGMTSGATVIGLATTNTRKAITGKAHSIIAVSYTHLDVYKRQGRRTNPSCCFIHIPFVGGKNKRREQFGKCYRQDFIR